MNDKTFYKNVARICDDLLKNAAHSFGIDFGVLNETMIELGARAKKVGLTYKDLYAKSPEEKA